MTNQTTRNKGVSSHVFIFLIIVFVLPVSTAWGQDTIIKTDGSEIVAKVVQVGTDEISYKKFENPEGPTYRILKSDVFMIRYENGTKDVFGPQNGSEMTSGSKKPLPDRSLQVNALGLLQFGPVVQYEIKLKQQLYLVPHFRYAYAGLLTHLTWTSFEGELSPGTAAVGMGIKSFAENVGNTWYYGGILDYEWGKATYDAGEQSESEEIGSSIAILSNVGYRWRSSRTSNLSVGLLAGVALDIKAEETFINTGRVEDNRGTYFFAMVELAFGWEYNK